MTLFSVWSINYANFSRPHVRKRKKNWKLISSINAASILFSAIISLSIVDFFKTQSSTGCCRNRIDGFVHYYMSWVHKIKAWELFLTSESDFVRWHEAEIATVIVVLTGKASGKAEWLSSMQIAGKAEAEKKIGEGKLSLGEQYDGNFARTM